MRWRKASRAYTLAYNRNSESFGEPSSTSNSPLNGRPWRGCPPQPALAHAITTVCAPIPIRKSRNGKQRVDLPKLSYIILGSLAHNQNHSTRASVGKWQNRNRNNSVARRRRLISAARAGVHIYNIYDWHITYRLRAKNRAHACACVYVLVICWCDMRAHIICV